MEPVDYRILAEFRYQIRTFLRFSEQEAKASGLQPQQHQLLLALKGLPSGVPPTISSLASRLHLQHHTVVGLADRLCKQGYLIRKGVDGDRRMVHLVITRSGHTVLRQLSIIHRRELQSAVPLLLKTLKKLIDEKRNS